MMQLTRHCWLHPSSDSRVNAGLVETGAGVVVIDTLMTPGDGTLLAGHAGEVGPTRLIIYTHHHHDHVGGSIALGEVEIAASADTVALLEAELASRPDSPCPRMPSLIFDRTLVIRGEPEVRVWVTGGHSPGSAVAWVPEDGCLFTGDLVFRGRPPFLAAGEPERWLGALDELAGLGAETVVPGHGPAGGPEVLSEQRAWFDIFLPRAQELAASLPLDEAVLRLRDEFGYEDHQDWMLEIALRGGFGPGCDGEA